MSLSRPYREVSKPFSARTLEFVQALQLVADSLQRVRQGEARHLLTLSGQLRALLIERSKGVKPLLLSIASDLQRDLSVYCMPDVNDPDFPNPQPDALLLHVSGFPITFHKQFVAQSEVSFADLLNRQILNYKGNKYTAKTIIEWYANKAGGAHYAVRVPEDFVDLLQGVPHVPQPLANILVQIGEATFLAGQRLLKSLIDLELHAVVVVPKQDAEAIADVNYLVDFSYEGSPMRLSLILNKRLMPSFFVRGLKGNWARVDSDRLIDWSKCRYLRAVLRIEDDLSSMLELSIDGVRVGRQQFSEPLFVLSKPVDYEFFHNRQVEGPPQKFSFGVASMALYGAELDPLGSAQTLLYFNELQNRPDLSAAVYAPEAYAHAARGTTNLTMTGNVRKQLVGEILEQAE